jgi:uncharacterized protein YjbI with pentapeptide repeats
MKFPVLNQDLLKEIVGRVSGAYRKTIPRNLTRILRFLCNKYVFAIFGIVLIFVFLWQVPSWQVSSHKEKLTPKEKIQLENDSRKSWAQVFGIFGGIAIFFFTWWRIEVAREGQITERFTRAIDQLGAVDKDNRKILEVRLGGIYGLERISKDSRKDYWTIMEILTAYVRENAHRPEEESEAEEITEGEGQELEKEPSLLDPEPPTDIKAIITVLRRRKVAWEEGFEQSIDLSDADLTGANLCDADLKGASLARVKFDYAPLLKIDLSDSYLYKATFRDAGLDGANLRNAYLERANLKNAQLREVKAEGAILLNANLEGALLWNANLKGAYLANANLEGAWLEDANLQGAFFKNANLLGVLGLTVEQLSKTKTLFEAQLAPELRDQLGKRYPHLFEKPEAG